MRTLVWEAPRVMNLREAPEPRPAEGEVLVRVAFAGICGSELSGYLGHNALRVPPLVMGHEFSGVVSAVGPGAAEKSKAAAVGRRVTANPLTYCGSCRYCRAGVNQLCPSRRLIGAHRPGAFAEFVAVPAELLIPLPDGMDLKVAAMTEPAAVAVRIGELSGEVRGEAALVMGAGPIGLLALQALRLKGASPLFISDVDPARLAMGGRLGAGALNPKKDDVVKVVRDATGGLGAAVCVDAVGLAATRDQGVAAARPQGTLILSGLHEEKGIMPAADIIRKEIVVRGAFGSTPANLNLAVERLASGEMGLSPGMVEAPLGEGGRWFDRLISAPGDVSKVLLDPWR